MTVDGEDRIIEGVASIGNRPTVYGIGDILEVYLFDFNADIYGRRISIELIEFIRAEAKFDSVEEMRIEIERDVEKSRAILQSQRN